MAGAILTQQTTWEKVEETLDELRERNVLSPQSIVGIDQSALEQILRPCGFFRQKARRLKALASYLVDRYDSDPRPLLEKGLDEAREELLSLKGVGEETADSILLFAGNRPKFVAATYVARVFTRTGVLGSSRYGEIQRFVESSLAPDPAVYAKLYAKIVELAKTYCLRRPRCAACPLRPTCAYGLANEEKEGVPYQR